MNRAIEKRFCVSSVSNSQFSGKIIQSTDTHSRCNAQFVMPTENIIVRGKKGNETKWEYVESLSKSEKAARSDGERFYRTALSALRPRANRDNSVKKLIDRFQ